MAKTHMTRYTPTTDELKEAYGKLRIDVFCKTGDRPPEMERISHELGIRGAKEWQIIKNSNLSHKL